MWIDISADRGPARATGRHVRLPGRDTIHPHVFRSLLSQQHLVEYQVRQTASGADIAVATSGAVDTDAWQHASKTPSTNLGLPAPSVTITRVDAIDRQASGKLKRFVPS